MAWRKRVSHRIKARMHQIQVVPNTCHMTSPGVAHSIVCRQRFGVGGTTANGSGAGRLNETFSGSLVMITCSIWVSWLTLAVLN